MTTHELSPESAVTVCEERGIQVMTFPPGHMRGDAVRQMYELTVSQITQPNARLLVDLTGLNHVSSAALGMFVTLRKKCLGVGSQMILAVPDPHVWEAFRVTGLDRFLPLYPTREQAFSQFKPPAREDTAPLSNDSEQAE
jgi:anti-anti-sigma factor